MQGEKISQLDSVHEVKILLCYLLDRLERPVNEDALSEIARESGVINYFYFADALTELKKSGAVSCDGQEVTLTEKGRMSAAYWGRNISLVYRRRLLETAFSYFVRLDRRAEFECRVDELPNGFTVSFRLKEKDYDLINMSFYAPDREQAEHIAGKIRSNPLSAYSSIMEFLVNVNEEKANIEKYL